VPVAPTPSDPNAPPTGPPAKPDTKTITVVYDSQAAGKDLADSKFLKRLADTQAKYPDHKVKYADYEDVAKVYTKLSKVNLPAIQVTDADGVTLEASTQPTPNPFPWQAALAAFVSGFTDPTSIAILGAWLLTAIRNRRINNNKKLLLSSDLFSKIRDLIPSLFGTPKTPTPVTPAPNGVDLSELLNSPLAQQAIKWVQDMLASKNQPAK
jgi:hypothetical protein